MVSSTSQLALQKTSPGSSDSGAMALPETGGFDLFGSLLGLQVDPNRVMSQTDLESSKGDSGLGSILDSKEATEEATFPRSLRKDRAPWDLLFPGLLPDGSTLKPLEKDQPVQAARSQERPLEDLSSSRNPIQPLLFPENLKGTEIAMERGRASQGEKSADLSQANPMANQADFGTKLAALGRGSVIAEHSATKERSSKVHSPRSMLETVPAPDTRLMGASPKASDQTRHVNDGSSVFGVNDLSLQAQGGSVSVREASSLMRNAVAASNREEKPNTELSQSASSFKVKKASQDQSDSTDGMSSLVLHLPVNQTGGASRTTHPERSQDPAMVDVPQLFSKVGTLAQRGGGKMTVSLSPPHLGQLEIQVTTKGKKVQIEMLSDSHEAKSLLESQLTDLKTSMHSQDLQLSRVEIQVSREVAVRPEALLGQAANQGFSSPSQSFGGSSRDRHAFNLRKSAPTLRAVSASAGTVKSAALAGPLGRVDLRI